MNAMHGGEIFVPRIPSIRITDLAEAMAPGMPHRMVGIRPGEKLHEVMITEGDARTTFALPDRYVIEPDFAPERTRVDGNGEQRPRVEEEFRYSSDANPEFLSVDEIRVLLEESIPDWMAARSA